MSNPNAALVTGASGGIGAVYANRLARRGHDLILAARDETRLNTLAERLRTETGRSVEVLVADLSARADLLRIEHRLREDPSIVMLVNNAGVAVSGPMHGSDVDPLEAMVDLNITAPLRLAHAAVAGFVARGPRDADQCRVRARAGARAVQRHLQRHEGINAEPQHCAADRADEHRHPRAGGVVRRPPHRTLGQGGHRHRDDAVRPVDGHR
jgi:NADP-dependent 3-hydroxy acid dehydrogenase YdfG